MKKILLVTLFLSYTSVYAQTIKKDLLLTETFTGDTFDNLFQFYGNYTRRTSEFSGLKMLTKITAPHTVMSFNSDTLRTRYLNGNKYDSLQVKLRFKPRVLPLTPVDVKMKFKMLTVVLNSLTVSDTGTKVFNGTFLNHYTDFSFYLDDTSSSIYVDYVKIWGCYTDTANTDTITTGIKENIENAELRFYDGVIAVKCPAATKVNVSICSISGNTVYMSSLPGGECIIRPELPAGLYIATIEDNNGRLFRRRIVIQ